MRPILLAAMLPLALPAAAQDGEAKARALMAQSKAATGGAAWDKVAGVHVVSSVATSGLTGTGEAWIDSATGRYADRYVLGPDKGAEGFDGQVYWTQDASGEVRPEAGGSSRLEAATEAYKNALAYYFPERAKATLAYEGRQEDAGRGFDVVAAAVEGGRTVRFWLDAETHRIERIVEKKEIDVTTDTLSDFRTVDGVQVAFHDVTSIGKPQYDQVTSVTTLEFVPAFPASRFAPPPPPPPDYAFAGGVDRVTLPFRLLNNHIYVEAGIEGHAEPFVFDTGASNYLHKDAAARDGVKAEGALPGGGVGTEKEDTAIAKVGAVTLGALTVRDQLFAVAADGGWPAIEGAPSSGLLGYEITKRLPTIIDYQARTITFVRPDAFQPPAGATAISFRFAQHLPEFDGTLDGIPARMHVDTGSRASVDFTSPFVAKHGLIAKYKAGTEATTGWGVGGAARSRLARAGTMTLGAASLQKPVIELSTQQAGAFSSDEFDANLGGEILRRFTLVLDYGHQTLWLIPNAALAEPFTFDRSGMFLKVDGADYVVLDVTPGGPAAEAGLKAGDRIASVDGKGPAERPLPELRLLLKTRPAGAALPCALGDGRKVTLTLRDLV